MLDPNSILDLGLIAELEDRKILEEFHCVRVQNGEPSQCAHLDGEKPIAHCRSHGMKLPVALMGTCPLRHVARIVRRAMRKAGEEG